MRIALALDQPRAHEAFQFLDLMRQRRRRDVEPVRGAGKMLLFREHRETAGFQCQPFIRRHRMKRRRSYNDIWIGNVNADRISSDLCVAVAGSQNPTKAAPAYMRACLNLPVQPPIAPVDRTPWRY